MLRSSQRMNRLLEMVSGNAEAMWWRLHTQADDFGRFQADPLILLSGCFPLRVEKLRSRTVAEWYGELEKAGLVRSYRSKGVTYGVLTDWSDTQKARAKESKHPDPDKCEQVFVFADICEQPSANVPVIVIETVIVTDIHADVGKCEQTPTSADKPALFEVLPAEDAKAISHEKAEEKAEVLDVYRHYCRVMGRNPNQYSLTPTRAACIQRRLQKNLPERLKAAIDACASSPHHMGQNDTGVLYNDLVANILKSEDKMEWWLNRRPGGADAS